MIDRGRALTVEFARLRRAQSGRTIMSWDIGSSHLATGAALAELKTIPAEGAHRCAATSIKSTEMPPACVSCGRCRVDDGKRAARQHEPAAAGEPMPDGQDFRTGACQ